MEELTMTMREFINAAAGECDVRKVQYKPVRSNVLIYSGKVHEIPKEIYDEKIAVLLARENKFEIIIDGDDE